MNATEILNAVEEHGASIELRCEKIHVFHDQDFPAAIIEEIRMHRDEIIAILSGRYALPLPPLPKSIQAALEFLRRVNFERDITPKMHDWIDKQWDEIEAYERAMIERRNWEK